jgi:hypothetical protein
MIPRLFPVLSSARKRRSKIGSEISVLIASYDDDSPASFERWDLSV